MHGEYGDLDCDYVFVNLFGGRIGQPLCYPAVHRLAARISARTRITFTVHMLRHTHATELKVSGVASVASFGGSRECRGPGLGGQRRAGWAGARRGRHAA